MDGNFKAEHLHAANPADEVSLMDGLGFMVSDQRYKQHLSSTEENAHRSQCNNHRAVNQANASRHRLEATGIGGCACARHGCFVPHAMVDFQKGERSELFLSPPCNVILMILFSTRQMNMDYALSYAANYHTAGLNQIITFYDINCQYNKYLQARMDKSQYLSLPWTLKIIPGIGLWHIHGHQDSCYCRYAPTFIPGAARIDGEIMETLWASLNIISPSARGMGTPHRKEVLDFQMGDCNFMKMIRMSTFLCHHHAVQRSFLPESACRQVFMQEVQSCRRRCRREYISI